MVFIGMIGHPKDFEKYLSMDASKGRTVVKYIQFLQLKLNFFEKKTYKIEGYATGKQPYN